MDLPFPRVGRQAAVGQRALHLLMHQDDNSHQLIKVEWHPREPQLAPHKVVRCFKGTAGLPGMGDAGLHSARTCVGCNASSSSG